MSRFEIKLRITRAARGITYKEKVKSAKGKWIVKECLGQEKGRKRGK